ncbi:MAG: class I SAM-dependent methyltransferase [Lacunisphaera sp.]|nr:class I SAM-dependent methyltransferase [Lacunisphaera sp.]
MSNPAPSSDSAAPAALLRPHLHPATPDPDYLVLSDLRNYLEQFRTVGPLQVLDYGAGNSPYRSLFPHANYKRADCIAYAGLDYMTDEDGRVPEVAEKFDLVLSTQVAEHLANPVCYFGEAFRLLKPGGRLIVTTHGVWEDHGAPYDFQRWTAVGLARDLAKAGFTRIETAKLTAGRRAYLFLFLHALGETGASTSRLSQLARRWLPWVRLREFLHRWADRRWPQYRVVQLGGDHQAGPPFYIVVAAVAVRPALQ